MGMSPGGNVSWETDNMSLGGEEKDPGLEGVVIQDVGEGVGKDGALGEEVTGRNGMMVARQIKGCRWPGECLVSAPEQGGEQD